MSNYTTVNEIIDKQVLKLNNIQSAIELVMLLKNQPNTIMKIAKHKDDLTRVIAKYNRLKDALNTQKHLLSDINVLKVKLKEVGDRTETMDTLLLNSRLTGEVSPYFEPVEEGLQPQIASGSSYEYSPQIKPTTYNRKDCKPPSIKFNLLEIEHLSDEEYLNIPKYMIRRMNLESINRFIDLFNKALSDKYKLISQPIRNVMGNNRQIYREFKAQETAATKGKYFVREIDVASLQGKKLFDKQSHNMITILRHTKRIFENRLRGVVDYVLM